MSMLRESAEKLHNDATAAGGEERQTPLTGLVAGDSLPEAGGFEEEGGRSSRLPLSHGSLLIVLVAVIAAGSLYLMRASQGQMIVDSEAKSLEAKIEQALAKLTNPQALKADDPLLSSNLQVLFRDTDAVVGMFTEDTSKHQVPLNALKKNPFLLTLARPVFDGQPLDPGSVLTQQLGTEFKDLKLDTVMQGARPVAIINGRLVQPGDRIGNFTVKSIEGVSVKLEAGKETFTLTMDLQGESGKRKK